MGQSATVGEHSAVSDATAISELAAPAPLNAVYSRIWEDPLAAAEAHAKTAADANAKNREVAGEENPRDTDAEKKTPEVLLQSYFGKRLHEFSQGSRKLLELRNHPDYQAKLANHCSTCSINCYVDWNRRMFARRLSRGVTT